MTTSGVDIPVGVYVHFPWCVRKCPYCDFNSHPLKGEIPQAAYTDALLADLALDADAVKGRRVSSIFLGGGTPSLMAPASIARLLDGVRSSVDLESNAEVTLEANPGTVDEAHFRGYAAAGVNRLSIGAQSFDAKSLERLGRIHGANEIARAVDAARAAGIHRINLDIMHGLPGQTLDDAMRDLRSAIELDVEHLSWYQLTLEPRTEFAANPPEMPEEDTLAAIEQAGFDLLDEQGYRRYEISAFTRGDPAHHNVNYWMFGDYLGIGAGAHGKISFAAGELDIVRTEKPKAPERYLRTATPLLSRRSGVAPGARAGEFMMNALRLTDGVTVETFVERTGLPITAIAPLWQRQIDLGMMKRDRLALTSLGQRYLDSVVGTFL